MSNSINIRQCINIKLPNEKHIKFTTKHIVLVSELYFLCRNVSR